MSEFDKVGCVSSTSLLFSTHIPSYRNLNPPVNTIFLSKRARKLQIHKYSQISFSRATYKNFKIAYDLNKCNLPHHITMLRLVGIVLVLKILLCAAPRKSNFLDGFYTPWFPHRATILGVCNAVCGSVKIVYERIGFVIHFRNDCFDALL